jgi:hypothetical protein
MRLGGSLTDGGISHVSKEDVARQCGVASALTSPQRRTPVASVRLRLRLAPDDTQVWARSDLEKH